MVNYNVKKNFTLLVDFYELTMANGFFQEEMRNKIVIFDMFFREVPDNGQYTIVAGLEQLIEYMENLHFSEEDIEFLREKNIFVEEFLDYLRDFKFECDVWAMPEGTLAFPEEPLLTVKGPAIQAQMLETMVLLTINHQSMIATKASRIVRQAKGRPVVEFGSRRAQGYSAANLGARAAYIGGCAGTANTLSDKMFGVPALGTMAHSWVQMFDTELEAFRAFARVYPDNCLLLVDTYDTLKEGVPNAIKIFDEEIQKSKTIVWNGPMGVFEIKQFSKGTFEVANSLVKSNATTIVGGGDSASAIAKSGNKDKVTHVSTGGGASLEFLEGKILPGIDCIDER